MQTQTTENLLLQIEDLQNRLAETDQLIEAIKAGEVDAFALNTNNKPEVFTLQSGDYAYRVLVENFSEGALNISEDGLIVYTNKSFHETLQLSYEKVIGQNISQFIHPDSKETFHNLFKKGLAGRSEGEINLMVGKKSCPVYVFLTSLYPTLPTVGVIISDLTEKKAYEKILLQNSELNIAKKQIEDSEHRFKLALQGSTQIVFSQDKNLKHTWIYNAHPDFKPEDIVGKSDYELHVPATARILTDIKQKVLTTGKAYNGDVEIEVGGQVMNYAMHIEPIKDAEENVTGIIGTVADITERKQAENKIKESENALAQQKQLLESVTANTDMALFLMDEKQYCIYMNQSAEIMTGFTLEELTGKQLHYYVHHSHPDGSTFPLEECPIDRALPSLNKVKGDEFFVHKDGSIYPVAFTASPIMHNGIAMGTVIEVRNTTVEKKKEQELKESEERFRNLAETLPQMVWVKNGVGSIEYASKNWKEYSGIEDVAEAWNYMMHPDDKERLTEYWNQVFAEGKGYKHEVRLKNKEGVYRWFYSVGKPVLDAEGKVSKWVGSLTDIHEQKNIEQVLELKVAVRTEELEQKNTELQNMNKELEAFTFISSHDLQEPLRKIQTFTGRIITTEKENLSETGIDYFNRMNDAAERMQALIQDLLTFSRVSTFERIFETTDLNNIVDEVKNEFKDALIEKQVKIEVGETCKVKIIPFQFRQLMHNLISNALKFSKPDVPPHIIIKSVIKKGSKLNNEELLQQNKYCHISITDNGIGFEKHFSKKIFEVFQRLHSKEEYTGTGIGLAIVKKIVDNHKGIITATSELGKGAQFDIYIPV